MAKTAKRKDPAQSRTFTIVITAAVAVMVAIVVSTVITSKEKDKAQSKVQYSVSPSATAASVNGKLGESTLPLADAKNEDGTDAAVGLVVPQITAQDFAGKDVTITPGTKPYVLVFLAHWCPHCQKEVPVLVDLENEGSLPEDVEFIAVATGTTDQKPNFPPSEWLLEEDWPWRKIADAEADDLGKYLIADAFGLKGYPYLVFVNADGTVASRMSGENEASAYIAAANAISESAKTPAK